MYNSEVCKNCPYIKDEFDARAAYLENKGYDDPEISSSCFCDKIGGKLAWYGYCGDEDTHTVSKISANRHFLTDKEKYRRRRNNTLKYKRKLKKQYENNTYSPSPCYPITKTGDYAEYEDEIAYYRPTNKSKHSTRYSYFKRYSNKLVRRHFKVIVDWEWYCFHEPWMDEDPEYMNLYCDEYGWEWDMRRIIDSNPRYDIHDGGAYKKVFDYSWAVD